MKKLVYFLLLGVSLVGCSTDDTLNVAQRNVVSNDNSVPFEELLVLINIKTTDNSYLVVRSIDSVNIFVNDFYWSKINSQFVDISKIDKQEIGNTYQTSKKINYLLIAGQDVEEPNFDTAGEFAQYLNAIHELKPGEYTCFIESFQVTFNDNTTKKYYPFEYRIFNVVENTRSAFVGEIEIKIEE